MTSPYAQMQAQTGTPKDLSRSVFNSIRLYLLDYKDTSKPKAERKKAIDSAYMITYWIVGELSTKITSFESEIVYHGFCKILSTVEKAKDDMSKIYDVSESIGFLKILTAEY